MAARSDHIVTVIRRHSIRCDAPGCDTESPTAVTSLTRAELRGITDARLTAHAAGFGVQGFLDLCPAHAPTRPALNPVES